MKYNNSNNNTSIKNKKKHENIQKINKCQVFYGLESSYSCR